MIKFFCLFLRPRAFDMPHAQRYDVSVWMMKMNGMMASSTNFSAVNWEASFVKTMARVS